MEIERHIRGRKRRGWLTVLLVCVCLWPLAQTPAGKCEFKDNEFLIEINKHASNSELDNLILKFDLQELNLKNVFKTNNVDTLLKLGWRIGANTQQKLIISKALSGSTNLHNPADNIEFTGKTGSLAQRFPATGNGIKYGYNRFRNKYPFRLKDSVVIFFLRGRTEAKKAVLAGSFNDFSPEAFRMKKVDSGWIAQVRLAPGKYWYKFVVDGNWMVDDDNYAKENDGEGNTNSVYFQPNHLFKFNGAINGQKAYVTASFNNWQKRELAMTKTAKGWQLPLYLADGTYTYKYIVDDVFYTDAGAPEKWPDGQGNTNAVIKLGNPYLFTLKGYTNAKQVVLSGSFNGWRKDELFMKKTAIGWELPYTLGAGNYQYKFIVDGNWILDPANPLTGTMAGETNSYLMLGANYTFRLRGMDKAKSVFLAGDFNNWAPSTLAMQKKGVEWVCSVYLSPGKHKYKYIVDGNWMTDPNNKLWEQNEFGNGNSVVWIDR